MKHTQQDLSRMANMLKYFNDLSESQLFTAISEIEESEHNRHQLPEDSIIVNIAKDVAEILDQEFETMTHQAINYYILRQISLNWKKTFK